MARIFIDGFESGSLDLWDTVSGAAVASSAGLDLDGSYCLNLTSSTGYVNKIITAVDEMYFAMRWRTTGLSDARTVFLLYNSVTVMIKILRDYVTGRLFVQRGTTTIATSVGQPFALNTTHLVEAWVKIDDSVGRVVVKVDGITHIDFTGDTKVGADTQFNKIHLGYDGSYSVKNYYDSFIMDDSDWIGNTNIQAVVPTGAGTTTEWTPSAGDNYTCVDEIPYSDADYVSTNTVDLTDTYATGDLVGTVSSVKCVQVQVRALTDGAPTPTNLKLAVRSGGTDYLSGDNLVPVTAKSFSHIWELNPADAAAWEEADVNAMEIGVKSSA